MDRKEKGAKGEEDLGRWLDKNNLSYVAICQSPETFARLFNSHVKRPDYLVLLDSLGLISVDAKNYTLSGGGEFTLKEEEFKKSIAFERIFRVPVWYAYRREEGADIVWYWISAIKAVEVGDIRENKETREKFWAIKLDQFARIKSNDDLGRLYTQRVPGYSKISRLAATAMTPRKSSKDY